MGATTIEYLKNGARCTSFIQGTASLADSVALAQSLGAYTNAGIFRVGYTVAQNSQVLPETPDTEFQTISYFALIFFRDEENNLLKLVIPAPKRAQYDLRGKNLRLRGEHGDALATLLGEKLGKTLTFAHGGVTSSKSG